MMNNFGAIMQLQQAWKTFTDNHPKFPLFMNAARGTLREGTVVDFKITTPEGRVLESNLKLTASDLEMLEMLRNMGGQKN